MKLARNNHPRAFVRVYIGIERIDYTVHVARLKTAVHGAWRRYPKATEVQVTRERYIHWSKS